MNPRFFVIGHQEPLAEVNPEGFPVKAPRPVTRDHSLSNESPVFHNPPSGPGGVRLNPSAPSMPETTRSTQRGFQRRVPARRTRIAEPKEALSNDEGEVASPGVTSPAGRSRTSWRGRVQPGRRASPTEEK
jgi:hypothetical protein